MNGKWKRWAGIGAVGAVMLVAGSGIGAAVLASPSASEVQLPSSPEQVGPLFGVVHADLDVTRYDGSTSSLVFDRGMIVSRTADSLTVARLDGRRVTVAIGPRTIVREGLRPATPEVLKVGDRAMVLSRTGDHGTLHAVAIRCVGGPRHREGAGN